MRTLYMVLITIMTLCTIFFADTIPSKMNGIAVIICITGQYIIQKEEK